MNHTALLTDAPEIVEIESTFEKFYQTAEPYLHPRDEETYEKALALVEVLIDKADASARGLDSLIKMLAQGIAEYESKDKELATFKAEAEATPPDVAMLRLLMSQHKLRGSDLPEIGDKTLISKILSGERNLTKQHIVKLSKRFNIDPALFF